MKSFTEFVKEQGLEELSKKTLGSYVKKASSHMHRLGQDSEKVEKMRNHMNTISHNIGRSDATDKTKAEIEKTADKVSQKAHNRHGGISQAIRKLTKD